MSRQRRIGPRTGRQPLARGLAQPLGLLWLLVAAPLAADDPWRPLASGLNWAEFPAEAGPIIVVRADPAQWSLDVITRSATGLEHNRTARAWAEAEALTVAINAGMFQEDGTAHVGYLVDGAHVNSAHPNHYRSVAAFNPRTPDAPPFQLFDLDPGNPELETIRARYGTVIQNLRLIQRPGQNRWSSDTNRTWSEAALGEDKQGRILFLFAPDPRPMHRLNETLLQLPLELVAAQHLEGGPTAQLYIAIGDREWRGRPSGLLGSLKNGGPPPGLPNILGLRPRQDRAGDS